MKTFSDAYEVLKDRIAFTGTMEWSGTSLLGSIIAANYASYTEQRQGLREVFETDPRFADYHQPPPPPYSSLPPPPPSLPPKTTEMKEKQGMLRIKKPKTG